jgi:hypothetical protein
MKRISITAFVLAVLALQSTAFAASVEAVQKIATTELAALGRDPVIVAAVKAQNDAGRTLDEIKALDAKWQGTAGVADFMKALIDSPAGKHLTAWKQSHAYVSEVFVMDKLGANVAQTDKTSDYWQGDEKKFTECFKGKGEVFLGKMEFDESTQTYSIQVSVPVLDGNALIGAICIGIDVEKVQ